MRSTCALIVHKSNFQSHPFSSKDVKFTELDKHNIRIMQQKGQTERKPSKLETMDVGFKLLSRNLKNPERSRTKKGLEGKENFKIVM